MARSFRLEILTPDRAFYRGEAEYAMLPLLDGMYGVLYGHEPVTAAIAAGLLRYQTADGWQEAVVGQGFAEVRAQSVVVLVSSAEHPEEIDRVRAQRALERAQEELRFHQSREEHLRSQAAMARALARLKARK